MFGLQTPNKSYVCRPDSVLLMLDMPGTPVLTLDPVEIGVISSQLHLPHWYVSHGGIERVFSTSPKSATSR